MIRSVGVSDRRRRECWSVGVLGKFLKMIGLVIEWF